MLWSGADRLRSNRKVHGVIACALTSLALCAAGVGVGDAQEPGNAARGRLSAGDLCADCHRTEPGAGHSPSATAPPFAEVAKTKGMTAMALNVWLRTSHPTMPNIMLRPDTADDIITYILSLRARIP
jgi:mono/diheme cytochrome c family protein